MMSDVRKLGLRPIRPTLKSRRTIGQEEPSSEIVQIGHHRTNRTNTRREGWKRSPLPPCRAEGEIARFPGRSRRFEDRRAPSGLWVRNAECLCNSFQRLNLRDVSVLVSVNS